MKRIRFSLRTLLMLVLTIAGGIGLWWRWEPWMESRVFSSVMATSFDRKLAVISNQDSNAKIVRLETGECISELADLIRIEEPGSHSYEFCQDDSRVFHSRYRSDKDGPGRHFWRFWDVPSGREISHGYQEFVSVFNSINVSPDGRTMARSSVDGSRTWLADIATGAERVELKRDQNSGALSFSADGKWVGREHIWDASTGALVINLSDPNWMVFSPDGLFVAVGFPNGNIDLWDLSLRCRLATLPTGAATTPVRVFGFSNDNTHVAIQTAKPETIVWDCRAQRKLMQCDSLLSEFATNGKFLLLNSNSENEESSQAELWDLESRLAKFPMLRCPVSINSDVIGGYRESGFVIYIRRRPEHWWGIAWLPEFWIAAVCGLGAVWSFLRDRRKLKTISET